MTFPKKKFFVLLAILIVVIGCSNRDVVNYLPISYTGTIQKKEVLTDSIKKYWEHKDVIDDTIPGLSLEKAFHSILKDKKGDEVIVAILDFKIDVNHQALANRIWTNTKEIANNNMDDDVNGYVDDIHGWNFLGNSKGENIIHASNQSITILRAFKEKFKGKEIEDISEEYLADYKKYLKAKNDHAEEFKKAKKRFQQADSVQLFYLEAREALKGYFPEYQYSLEILETIDTIGNGLSKYVNEIKTVLDYNDTDENMHRVHKDFMDEYKKRANIEYNERVLLGDDLNDLSDTDYGNNLVSDRLDVFIHGTQVASMIAKSIENGTSLQSLKIMPVCVAAFGSTQDKDVARGIRYAVDNGAKVVNMSFSRKSSLRPEWVYDALKYAEKHHVLVISSAGNDGHDLNNNDYFPNDTSIKGKEVSDNFLLVGATTSSLDKNLLYRGSNYGNEEVDIFAPGSGVYNFKPNNYYAFGDGTSFAAPLVARVAALLFSYYPNLTASQVKHIIMDSGVRYTIPVKTPTKEDKEKTTPFSELSKSGRVLNAYNALIMADSISKTQNLR